jgi:hypothetical protein
MAEGLKTALTPDRDYSDFFRDPVLPEKAITKWRASQKHQRYPWRAFR